jgi:hypothetical protein
VRICVLFCFVSAAASGAFDREDAPNLVWPQIAASGVSLAKGEFMSSIPHFLLGWTTSRDSRSKFFAFWLFRIV